MPQAGTQETQKREDDAIREQVLALIDRKGGEALVSEVVKGLVEQHDLTEDSVKNAVRALLEVGPLELGENFRLVHNR